MDPHVRNYIIRNRFHAGFTTTDQVRLTVVVVNISPVPSFVLNKYDNYTIL